MVGYKDRQGTNVCKDAHAIDRANNSIDLTMPAVSSAGDTNV